MATTQYAHKFRVGRSDWPRARRKSLRVSDDPQKHILPGIGTFVIDAPRDRASRVRQQCLKYQEEHRGVLRERIDSLPDIPKRCDMKSLPVVQFHDLASDRKEEVTSPPGQPEECCDGRWGKTLGSIRRLEQNLLTRKDSPTKLASREELLSRSPLRNLGQALSTRSSFGFRKSQPDQPRTEFTNLTSNISLSAPGPVCCKATEKELSSQAEYRRQLTFLLNQLATPTPEAETGGQVSSQIDNSGEDTDLDTCRSLVDLPPRHVGHTSRHNLWESQRLLKELVSTHAHSDRKSRAGPTELKPGGRFSSSSQHTVKAYATVSNTPRSGRTSGSVMNSPRVPSLDVEDRGLEDWTNMANSMVIDPGIYDRYANVKRPVSRGATANRSLQGSRACSFGSVSRELAACPTKLHTALRDSPSLAHQHRSNPRP